jgi:hypothetical protein
MNTKETINISGKNMISIPNIRINIFSFLLIIVFSNYLSIPAVADSYYHSTADFGAVGDGITNDTKSIQRAIDKAADEIKSEDIRITSGN